MASSYDEQSLTFHKDERGKLRVVSKIPLTSLEALSIAYTPGVAAVSSEVAKDPRNGSYDYTWRGNAVAVISDGSAVLGLGNIGPEGALPVMEGKAAIMQELAGVNGVPLVVNTQDADEIVSFVKTLVPSFGAINLEDISAPRCFAIEEQLQDVGIPVFHDDQHGTAIVVLAALINGLKRVKKAKDEIRVVISGAGAAGIATARLLQEYGVSQLTLCDSKGIIGPKRTNLNPYKQKFVSSASPESGTVTDALREADVFIGVSKGNILTAVDIAAMRKDALVFCMSNPDPELPPLEAEKAENIAVYGTGRSDLPNQINNAIAFPGLFRGLLDARAEKIDRRVFIHVAHELAELAEDELLPRLWLQKAHEAVAEVVRDHYLNAK